MNGMPVDRIMLYGAGGHAKVILELIEENKLNCTGIYDEYTERTELLGYPVFRALDNTYKQSGTAMVIAVGNNKVRRKLVAQLQAAWTLVVHPRACLSTRCHIGEGTVVMAGVSINSEARIGRHCIINTNSSVDHDCRIGDYVHISPNAALAGNVEVGEGTHIGIGATVIQGIKIGKWVTVGAGSVIIRDVPDYAVIVGNPGRIIKMNAPQADGDATDKPSQVK